jgi:hypothetical protein
MSNKHTVLFLHIPKTAGSTLNGIIDSFYGPSEIINIYYPENAWNETDKYYDIFAQTNPALVRGHFYYGIHKHIRDEFAYVTVLRDPVERVVSNYYHISNDAAHPFHPRLVSEKLTLSEFVLSEMDSGNLQTRLIAGLLPPWAPCGEEHLEKAKSNIRDHFALAGFTERFDESILMLKSLLGWREWPFYAIRNKAKKRLAIKDISEDEIEAVRQASRLDIELYGFAMKEFDYKLSRLGPEFKKTLEEFRGLNAKKVFHSKNILLNIKNFLQKYLKVR